MTGAAAVARARAPWARLLLSSRRHLCPSIPHFRVASASAAYGAPIRRFSVGESYAASQPPPVNGDRIVQELLAEVEREKQREREERRRAGITEEAEDDKEDYMGVGPLIEKLERRKAKEKDIDEQFWEPTDTESDEDDERFKPEELKRQADLFDRKIKRHAELLKNFAEAETLDESYKWRTKIEKFEEKHFNLPLEYRVIGDLMNILKKSTGKERFILLQKLNRGLRKMQAKEEFDPNNPENFGIIQHKQIGSPEDIVDNAGFDKEREMIQGMGEDEEDDINELKDKNDILKEKLNALEKKIQEKMAYMENIFGKKRRVLEEEMRVLIDERNALTARSRRPLYRKGFSVKVINVNRTCKVTKGGQLVKFSALLATGNFHGVVGFARAKGPTAKIAIQRAYEKCFQNLHYIERHEEHTIAHAVQAKYEKTKVYLWPAPMRVGVRAGQTVETILYLAGFSNVKTKIIGSRNPLNVVKALFIALNAIETPKDMQEKLGRTVVESYLL